MLLATLFQRDVLGGFSGISGVKLLVLTSHLICIRGGTGMITMGWKAGTGSASRVIESEKIGSDGAKQKVKYTLAALVQSNFGGARFLTVNGVPVGRILADQAAAAKKAGPMDGPEGSIIVVVATDAPLIPIQLQRIAKRATVGVARSELFSLQRRLTNEYLSDITAVARVS